MESDTRDFPETGTDDSKVDYQEFEHSPLDLVTFVLTEGEADVLTDTLLDASVRIHSPELRVVFRPAIIFQPKVSSERAAYNLALLKNSVVAYGCIRTECSRIARVTELVGNTGIPYEFPKSDIDGYAFQSHADLPYIDIDLKLGVPGVEGRWTMFLHATSDNKLKRIEWENMISKVSMSVLSSPGVRYFANIPIL